jgi:carotenoid cleavage dioxygenase-like enzyme
VVARKRSGRFYYVVECSPNGMQRKRGEPLYVWHVGDGFEHSDGWWTETE